jgi:putative membrane protein
MMWDWNGWGWWWVVMPLMMVAFWGAVAWVIVTVVRNDRTRPWTGENPGSPSTPTRSEAERILAERFARGEIDAEEYRRRLDVLHGGSGNRAA